MKEQKPTAEITMFITRQQLQAESPSDGKKRRPMASSNHRLKRRVYITCKQDRQQSKHTHLYQT